MELLTVYLDLFAVALRAYRRTEDEKYIPIIEQFKKARDDLNEKINRGDYTERDARKKEIEDLMDCSKHHELLC